MTNGNSYFEQTKWGRLALLPRLGADTDGRRVKEKSCRLVPSRVKRVVQNTAIWDSGICW